MKFEVESRLDDLFGDSESVTGESEETPLSLNEDTASSFLEPEDPEEPEFLDIQVEGVDMQEKHPLDDLKSTVLSIDWEITDEVMSRFVNQVEDLKKEFRDNKINLLFLQLLGSVGVYIKTNRGKADPEAFKVLGSSFKAFDDVVSSNNMPNTEKKNKLTVELEKFKELKKKIAAKKQAVKPPSAKAPEPMPVQASPRLEKPIERKAEKRNDENDHIQLVVQATSDSGGNKDDIQEIILNPISEKSHGNSQEIIDEVLMEMKKFIRGEFDDLREELRLRKKRR